MTTDRPAPAVSVIIATYNRARVLRYAIESVRRSTISDWELIVVGDACTDDTAAVVASFDDPRIQFVNLPERCGDQSGPNNHGISIARGRFIAFLNHDDLYFPEHLETCLAEIETSGADLVWVPAVRLLPEKDRTPAGRFMLIGVPGTPGYSPYSAYVATTWVLKRELVARVGPWRRAKESFVTPSQAWLFRAWRMGASLRFVPRVGAILILAGERAGSYAEQDASEHQWLSNSMVNDPRCREKILEEAAINEAMARTSEINTPQLRSFRRFFLRPVYALSTRVGLHPSSWPLMLKYGRRGGFVRALRKHVGVK